MSQQVLYNWIRFGALLFVTGLSVFFFWPREEGQLLNVNLGLDLRGGCMLKVELEIPPDKNTPDDRAHLMEQTLVVLSTRVNSLGLTEPIISQVGDNRVLIELPGAKTSEDCEQIVNIRGILEFKKVLKSSGVRGELKPEKGDQEVLPGRECFVKELKDKCEEYLVEGEPLLKGDALEPGKAQMRIQTTPGSRTGVYVSLALTAEGGRDFGKALVAVGPKDAPDAKRLGIILDNQVYSAPVVEPDFYAQAKTGKSIRDAAITGNFTVEEAKLLAAVLNAGALPTKLDTKQNLTVGPTLGQDSIDKGLSSTLIAGLVILLFMIFYYRLSGFIADFTMLLNIAVLLGALAVLNATLTLPGIAGIILTIGMGVDSNVLIFERMREELKTGKQARAAIDAGYTRALTTIIDSHVTTFFTGLILFIFGTGPIRGFAITLCLGIAINLFTALVGTRMVFEFLKLRRIQRLSI